LFGKHLDVLIISFSHFDYFISHLSFLLFKNRLSVFVESLESLSESHTVSFKVDSRCYFSLQIYKILEKGIWDQLQCATPLKLALFELPCCSIKSCFIYPSTLLIYEFDYSWTKVKWIHWGTRQFYTVLTYKRVVFFNCFFILMVSTTNLNFRTSFVILSYNFPNFKSNI
jgi:hypothetical protein